MAALPPKGALHRLLERAHSPDAANHIFTEKIQHRELFVRPTTPDRDVIVAPSASGDNASSRSTAATTTAAGAASLAAAAAAAAAAETAALGAMGHNGRDARRRARRLKQEQRAHHAKKLKPKPLSARERKSMQLYDVPMRGRNHSGKTGARSDTQTQAQTQTQTRLSPSQTYDTFLPLHQLWLGYIREILSPQERRMGGAAAAAKLVAADFHGAKVEVTRSACVSRVGTRGIVVRDARFVFEIVTPANKVKMIPKEGTFFRIEIPEEAADDEDDKAGAGAKMVFEIVGAQFMHRAIDRANRKFKQHFNKEL